MITISESRVQCRDASRAQLQYSTRVHTAASAECLSRLMQIEIVAFSDCVRKNLQLNNALSHNKRPRMNKK